MTKAAVIIPNLNGQAYLEDCLESLRGQSEKDFVTIVIDNGSTDESCRLVKERFPEVVLKRFSKNTGFCHAVNAGIRCSEAPYVILLNNDTRCRPDFVRELIACMERHPDAFSCQAKMLSMRDPAVIDDAGDFYCALGWAFTDARGKDASSFEDERKIFSSCAGAAVYRRSLLEKTGLFDERHFAYLEDVDICWRANILGHPSYLAPRALVLHAGSASTGSSYNEFKVRHTSRNSVYLLCKNMPAAQVLLNLPLLLAGFACKWAFFARLGYGRLYLRGLAAGAAMGRPEDRVPFKRENLKNYIRIQLQLWRNTVRRLCGI